MKIEDTRLLNPTDAMLSAMAMEREAQIRRNGHGEYAYRDLWLAGAKALLADHPTETPTKGEE